MATNSDHQSYGVKCEPDTSMNLQCEYYQPTANFLSEDSQEVTTDMDLTGFLDSMDDRVLSGECTNTVMLAYFIVPLILEMGVGCMCDQIQLSLLFENWIWRRRIYL